MDSTFALRNAGILFGLLALALPATGFAQIHIHEPGGAIEAVEYLEAPGELEFSGRMIARPIERHSWLAAGHNREQARAWMTVAHVMLSTYAVDNYVWETGDYVIECDPGDTENETGNFLRSLGVLEYVEPDWTVYPTVCSNDPLLPTQQWQHNANRMQTCDAWDVHTGDPSVSVGICDTGILVGHEDLSLHRLEGYNAVNRLWESQGGDISPVHPHGTETTGCAAANGNNGVGVSGVGWNLSHRMMRVSNVASGSASLSNLQHAARTAVENGDRVASVSYSGVDSASTLSTATYIKSIGGLLVWSAGNDNRNLTFGNRDADDVIVVGATDSNDNKASFSAYGSFVDVTAPGVSVGTTYSIQGVYVNVSGTSFSCPLTAGLIALMWSADPTLTPDEVEVLLKQGCDDLGSAGVDDVFGYGRINAFNSISLVIPPCPPGEIPDCNGNCAPDSWLADGTCDDGARMYNGVPIDFSCRAEAYDGGDCPIPDVPFVLFRHRYSGRNALWFMDGPTMRDESGILPTVAGSSWSVAGSGDFDGDGHADLMWRNAATGANHIWFLDGPSVTPTISTMSTVGGAWYVAAVDDFDGDGKADILFRHPYTGRNAMWLMDGTSMRPGSGILPTVASSNWTIAASNDFDTDGYADLLWRNVLTGANQIWFMDGTLTPTFSTMSKAGVAWTVVGTNSVGAN